MKWVEGMAKDIRKIFNITSPIADMRDIVEVMGGGTIRHEAATDFSVERSGRDKFTIIVPKKANIKTINWKVAQCLGELFLQMQYMIDPEHFNSYPLHKPHEPEIHSGCDYYLINQFAAALLMPRDQYMELVEKHTSDGKVNMAEVAEYFYVTKSDADYRGVCLGILRSI